MEPQLWMTVSVALACVLGAGLQRVSGAGVGLVVTPVMVLIFGPLTGVLLTNSITMVSATVIGMLVWRNIDWVNLARLVPVGLLGSFAGALAVKAMNGPWLQIAVGAVIILALVLTFSVPRLPEVGGNLPGMVAGTAGGFLNTLAGVAMPAMVIYAHLSRWEQWKFQATMQPVFFSFGFFSLATKLLVGSASFSHLPPWWFFAVLIVGILLGVGIGAVVAARVSSLKARYVAVVLAGVGAAVTVVRGVLAL